MPPAVRTCKLKEKENMNSYLWSLKSSTSPPGGNLVDGLPPDCSAIGPAYIGTKSSNPVIFS